MQKLSWTSLILMSASVALASTPRTGLYTRVDVTKIAESYAEQVAPITPNGQIGRWETIRGADVRNAPSWIMAWDSMSTNPTTLASYGVSPVYGAAHPGPTRNSNDRFRNFVIANDIQLANSTSARFARFVRLGIFWNPGGTQPKSGSDKPAVRIRTAASFDTTGDGPAADWQLGGVLATFGTLAAGNQLLVIDLSATSTGIPLPISTGSLVVELGRVGTGSVFEPVAAPFAVQPLMSVMLSPGEPRYPGNNPSKSTDLQWDDDSNALFFGDNSPDYAHQDFTNTANTGNVFAEQYSYDDSITSAGNLQIAAAVFADTNVKTISGTVALNGLTGSDRPKNCTFEVRSVSGNVLLSTQTVALSGAGAYTILDPNQAAGGNYNVIAKTSHWLAKTFGANTTGGISVSGRNVALDNGDVDHDNVVSVFDYIRLSDAFDLDSSANAWSYPDSEGLRLSDADLDGDGVVSVFDYIILSDNFDISGD